MKTQDAVKELIRAMGEDPSRPGLEESPELVTKMLSELGRGYRMSAEELLKGGILPNPGGDDLIRVDGIPFYSLCEHHLLPFFGTCSISYIPKDKILGFGKFPDLVELYARRLQLQERFTHEIADCLVKFLDPKQLTVQISAEQLCVTMRGKGAPGMLFHTEARR